MTGGLPALALGAGVWVVAALLSCDTSSDLGVFSVSDGCCPVETGADDASPTPAMPDGRPPRGFFTLWLSALEARSADMPARPGDQSRSWVLCDLGRILTVITKASADAFLGRAAPFSTAGRLLGGEGGGGGGEEVCCKGERVSMGFN